MADEVSVMGDVQPCTLHKKKELMWLCVQGLCAGLSREGMGISDRVFYN